MLRVTLHDPKTGQALDVDQVFSESAEELKGTETALVVSSESFVHGQFKTASVSGVGSATVVSPNAGGSLIITDLLLSGNKINNATITVRFADGTNNANLVVPDVTDAPVNLAHTFAGRFQGWKDAYLELVTDTASQDASLTVGYVKVPGGLPYAEWDALR